MLFLLPSVLAILYFWITSTSSLRYYSGECHLPKVILCFLYWAFETTWKLLCYVATCFLVSVLMSLLESAICTGELIFIPSIQHNPLLYSQCSLKVYLQDSWGVVVVGWHSDRVDHSSALHQLQNSWAPRRAALWGWREWHMGGRSSSCVHCRGSRAVLWWPGKGQVWTEVGNTWKDRKGSGLPGILPCSPDMATPFPGNCISRAMEDNWPCFHLVTLPTWLHLIEPGIDIQLHLRQWDSPSPRI